MSVRLNAFLAALFAAALFTASCGGGSSPSGSAPGSSSSTTPSANKTNVSLDKNAYPVFPNADAGAVVADDVVATWDFMMDKTLQDPSNQLVFGKFERPVAESKYIVTVHSKQLNWRNFLYFSGMLIFPSHVLTRVNGAAYLKDYNFKFLPSSGGYVVNESDIVKGKSVTIRLRQGYWADNRRRNIGLGNFDEVHEIVVRDQNLAFEMFKKGDIDFYYANISRQWVQELNFDKVQQGLILKRKVFNDYPSGTSGLAFNTRQAPFDDIRVRQALTFLKNRQLYIEKLFFNEYLPLNSYFAGGIYENPNNPKNPYDPQRAIRLLADAGWSNRDSQGRLVKNGEPLVVDVLYAQKQSETWLTVYQDDLRKVGIGLNLRLVTPETFFQLVMQRKFKLAEMAWGSLVFPNPETQFHSKLADQNDNNNIPGFKDKRVDELCDLYDKEFDQQKRIDIIREIDGIVANSYQYALGWDAPFQRFAYWNIFGHPESYLSRIGDYTDVVGFWWVDADKQRALDAAMRDPSKRLDPGQVEARYWQDFDKRQAHTAGTAK